MSNPTMDPYLASIIQKTQPTDNSMRTATVSALDGGTLRVLVNGGIVEAGYLASYDPQVNDTVAVIEQGGDWLVLGAVAGSATPSGATLSSAGRGVVASAYFSGGTACTSVGGAEAALAGWTNEDPVTFDGGQIYRLTLLTGIFDSNGVSHLANVRLRRGVNTTTGLEIALWRLGTVPNMGGQVFQHQVSAYVKNTGDAPVVSSVGVTIQRVAAGGAAANMSLYGDGAIRMSLETAHVGAVSDRATLAALAWSVS